MSLIDKLLQIHNKRIMEIPKREVEVPRLIQVLGGPFKVVCQAIDGERDAYI